MGVPMIPGKEPRELVLAIPAGGMRLAVEVEGRGKTEADAAADAKRRMRRVIHVLNAAGLSEARIEHGNGGLRIYDQGMDGWAGVGAIQLAFVVVPDVRAAGDLIRALEKVGTVNTARAVFRLRGDPWQ